MDAQDNEKPEKTTMKLTKQGVRDLNHLVRSKPPVAAEATALPVDEASTASEGASVPLEP